MLEIAPDQQRVMLRPYLCREINPRTGRTCRTVLLEAWSQAGALVRRRCKQCGAWSTISIVADPIVLD